MRASLLSFSIIGVLTLAGCNSSKTHGSQSTSSSQLQAAQGSALDVRHITVGMSHAQILSAASAANMRALADAPNSIKLADQTASGAPMGGASSTGGTGLVLLINLANDKATTVMISEQGDTQGHIFEDLSKKWGTPAYLPNGYNNEEGTDDKATWGDKNTVYAEYSPSIYGFGGQHVTIYDAQALKPHPQERKSVPM